MLLTNSNSKLGKSIYNFNLPRTTCEKFRSTTCNQLCYAKHGAWTFPSTVRKMEFNLWATQSPDFVRWICEEIVTMKVKWVRLHASGDFYNWGYAEKWVEIANRNPNVRFLAFTRNYSLRPNIFSANFALYISYDGYGYTSIPTAFLMIPQKPIAEYKHMEVHPLCSNDRAEARVCNSKCKDCRACWYSKFNIVFLKRWQGGKFDRKGTKEKPGLHEYRMKMEGA